MLVLNKISQVLAASSTLEVFPIPFKIVRMAYRRWYSCGWLEKLKMFLRDGEKWGIFSIISWMKAINVKIWSQGISVVSAVRWLQFQLLGSSHREREMLFLVDSWTFSGFYHKGMWEVSWFPSLSIFFFFFLARLLLQVTIFVAVLIGWCLLSRVMQG